MLIKHDNDKALNIFYENFKDYGKEYEEELKIYREEIDKITGKENNYLKRMSEQEFKKATFYSKKIASIYMELTKELKPVLDIFTQEMLFRICAESPYEMLREVCYSKLALNSQYMDVINNSYKSGRIFGYLNSISYEEKLRLLELREIEDVISITELNKIMVFLPEVKKLIEKSLTSDLYDEFSQFMQEHNLENIQELEFYKTGVENEKIINDSEKFKDVINEICGAGCGEYFTKDDSKRLRKVTFFMPKDDY